MVLMMMYNMLLCISILAVAFNIQNPSFVPTNFMTLYIGMSMFTEPHSHRPACFANVASATFTGNAIDALSHLLQSSFWPSFHKRAPKSVFYSEDGPNVVTIPYMLKLL
jgi:hypothetical protein